LSSRAASATANPSRGEDVDNLALSVPSNAARTAFNPRRKFEPANLAAPLGRCGLPRRTSPGFAAADFQYHPWSRSRDRAARIPDRRHLRSDSAQRKECRGMRPARAEIRIGSKQRRISPNTSGRRPLVQDVSSGLPSRRQIARLLSSSANHDHAAASGGRPCHRSSSPIARHPSAETWRGQLPFSFRRVRNTCSDGPHDLKRGTWVDITSAKIGARRAGQPFSQSLSHCGERTVSLHAAGSGGRRTLGPACSLRPDGENPTRFAIGDLNLPGTVLKDPVPGRARYQPRRQNRVRMPRRPARSPSAPAGWVD